MRFTIFNKTSGRWVLILSCFQLIALTLSANSLRSTKIQNVQVFSKEAIITRSIDFQFKKGRNSLQVKNLPIGLEEDSIRINLDSRSRGLYRVVGIHAETITDASPQNEEGMDARRLLQDSESKLRKLTDEYNSLKEEEKLLLETQLGRIPNDKDKQSIPISPAQWEKTLDFIQSSLRSNHDRMDKLLGEIDRARENLAIAIFIHERMESKSSLSSKVVTIEVDSSTNQNGSFQITYNITGAGWYPIYNAEYKNSKGTENIELSLYAFVKNETGEDWEDATLEFSTSSIDRNLELPEVRPWILESMRVPLEVATKKESYSQAPKASQYQPRPSSAKRAQIDVERSSGFSKQTYYMENQATIQDPRASKSSKSTEVQLNQIRENLTKRDSSLRLGQYQEAMESSEMAIRSIHRLHPEFRRFLEEEKKKSEAIQKKSLNHLENQSIIDRILHPSGSSEGFPFVYKALGRESLKSDGTYSKIFLNRSTYPAKRIFESNPQQTSNVYSVADIDYKEDRPLLSGPVSIYKDSDYLGESMISNVIPKSSFRIPMGIEPDIEVKRVPEEFREKSGIIRSNYSTSYTNTIQVSNKKKQASTIFIYERVPTSSQKDIRIDSIRFTINPDKENRDFGLFRFPMELAPSQSRELKIEYQVTFPREMVISQEEGGNPSW